MSVSNHLIEKWRKVFHYRDTDNDGVLKKEDYKRYCDKLIKVYGDRARLALEIATLVWSTISPKEHKSEVTEKEFVDNYSYLYQHHLKWFRQTIKKYCHLSFDVIDSNGDGKISLQEYTVNQISFEVRNHDYIEHVFNQLDTDQNGIISRKEFVDEMMNQAFEDAPPRIPEFYDSYAEKHFKKKAAE